MLYQPINPVIVQSDRSILLEVDNALYTEARDALARFAELVKSPEHIHTYRITPLSLWNAAAAGLGAEEIIDALVRYGKYELPSNVRIDIADYVSRYGRLKLTREGEQLLLQSQDVPLLAEIRQHKRLQPYVLEQRDAHTLVVDAAQRGFLKHALVIFGYPAEDLAGYQDGDALPIQLHSQTREGARFGLRHYQQEAVDVFHAGGTARGGSGVIVLPCGAGKTIVALGAMAKLQTATLILTPSTVAVRQWIDEILDKTSLRPDQVGEYSGLVKEIRPVTITTYQILTYRSRKGDEFPHFALFDQRNWGLIIYDEVHLLPAPVFRITAALQGRRRMGLTATLVREDERETDVFSLIGPKKYDVPWRELERQGWIATAECHEIRVNMSEEDRMLYAISEEREKYRLAAENEAKKRVIMELLRKHPGDHTLVIGQYLEQLEDIARMLNAPLITGKTPIAERERLYESFRTGETPLLVVSKVANFSIDLPDASVAIQISGTFGSRQEEAQRLGRILRPKKDGSLAHFYSLVSRDTKDQLFAAKRQLFLTEQGYRYTILYEEDLGDYIPVTELAPSASS
ncbi:MAG: DEAD/DEAH box helicase [Chloroflexi bacterium]|nr:DEAD/DEAH box helicase [Chloroflexota bacterium]